MEGLGSPVRTCTYSYIYTNTYIYVYGLSISNSACCRACKSWSEWCKYWFRTQLRCRMRLRMKHGKESDNWHCMQQNKLNSRSNICRMWELERITNYIDLNAAHFKPCLFSFWKSQKCSTAHSIAFGMHSVTSLMHTLSLQRLYKNPSILPGTQNSPACSSQASEH